MNCLIQNIHTFQNIDLQFCNQLPEGHDCHIQTDARRSDNAPAEVDSRQRRETAFGADSSVTDRSGRVGWIA